MKITLTTAPKKWYNIGKGKRKMKLSDLIEDLQELATIHGKDVDVEFNILIKNKNIENVERLVSSSKYHQDDDDFTTLGYNNS